MVDDEVVGNEGPDIHDDIVAYDDDRSCADYRLVLHDELHDVQLQLVDEVQQHDEQGQHDGV